MATFQEKLINKLIKENVVYHYAGYENMVLDGEMTQDEFNSMLTEQEAMQVATDTLNNAYRSGYLESPTDNVMIEAKHIKFLGNERIDYIKGVASRNALKQF